MTKEQRQVKAQRRGGQTRGQDNETPTTMGQSRDKGFLNRILP